MIQQETEWIGGTDGGFTFSPELGLKPVLDKIKQENDAVLADASTRPYVSVGYVVPLPRVPNELAIALRRELQGAYLAQYRANRTAGLGDVPAIRLLVVNVGDGGEQWAPVLPQIIECVAASEDRLVAVAGLGVSMEPTLQLLGELSARRVPMIASRLTADDLSRIPDTDVVPGLFRVSPTNKAQVTGLADYVKRASVRPLLIQDTNPDDPYVKSLGDRFLDALRQPPAVAPLDLELFDASLPGVNTRFAQMQNAICLKAPDSVFFAGRGANLDDFISAASNRPCPELPINLFTGDDGVSVATTLQGQIRDGNPELPRALAGINFRYSSLAHPGAWNDPNSARYFLPASTAIFREDCETCYQRLFGEPLDDGAALTGYDATLVAVTAARLAAGPQANPEPVTAGAVLQALYGINSAAPVFGASGPIAFDERGEAVGKPFPVLALGPDGTVTFVGLAGG